jgi:hypothetical protein
VLEALSAFTRGEVEGLILQALVRKLVAKGVLSQDDVRTLLLDAVMRLDDKTQRGPSSKPDQS